MNFELFPLQELTEQEGLTLTEVLKNPVLNKYLHTLAANEARNMVLNLNSLDVGTETFMRNQFYLKGRIDALSSLIGFQQIATKE